MWRFDWGFLCVYVLTLTACLLIELVSDDTLCVFRKFSGAFDSNQLYSFKYLKHIVAKRKRCKLVRRKL